MAKCEKGHSPLGGGVAGSWDRGAEGSVQGTVAFFCLSALHCDVPGLGDGSEHGL